MKYSSTLIKKLIGVNDTPENIAKNLILKTCEIEGIHTRVFPDDVVIGKVTEFHKHPDADKLSVCQVDCGRKGKYEIVCGGENLATDIYVPVALPNCFLPAINIKIEPRKLKGIMSNGMICSKEELGINEDLDKHRIRALVGSKEQGERKKEKGDLGPSTLYLGPNYDFDDITDEDLGTPLKVKYPWLEGYVLEVDSKSLTNRPDLTGHRGVCTELNAIYSVVKGAITFDKVIDYYKQFASINIIETLDNGKKIKKKVISETDGLNTYILMEINNVSIKPSSFFSRLQMIDLGSVPRNNWVDFSNLFMLISGQPIHFFDADKIDGHITVRNAKEGEEFVDLFETKHILQSTDIVIADDKKLLALAGVVGGMESGITDKTKNILVEIANFDSVAVRKTGTRLGLRTDAELRYEKNINPVYSLYCLLLFLDELKYYGKDLGNYEIGGLDYFASKNVIKNIKNPKKIDINFEKMSDFVFGKKIIDLPPENKNFEELAGKYLSGLGFVLEKKGNRIVPMRRGPDDINIVEDIYEDVSRLYGYENIPNLPLLSPIQSVKYDDYVGLNRKMEEVLVRNLHFNQTETYPWISPKIISEWKLDPNNLYVLQNPVNPEMPYLRDDMIYGLLAHVAKNSKFFDEFRIFDIGKIRNKSVVSSQKSLEKNPKPMTNDQGLTTKFASSFVNEQGQVGMMIYVKDIVSRDKDPILIAKNMIKVIFKELGIGSLELSFKKTENLNFHPKKQANIVCKVIKSKVESLKPDFKDLTDLKTLRTIGFVGSLHPLILKDQKIAENAGVVYISLNMDQILNYLKNTEETPTSYETLQDQIVYRDLCFVVDNKQDFGEILEAVKGVDKIKDLEVFDVYSGSNLGEDKKSVSIKIKIMGDGNTVNGDNRASMTTEQINEVMNKAIKVAEQTGGKLRD